MSLTITHASQTESSTPIIEVYLQKASAAVTQLLTVVAEELERDRPNLSDRSKERLRDLVTSVSVANDLLLGSDS